VAQVAPTEIIERKMDFVPVSSLVQEQARPLRDLLTSDTYGSAPQPAAERWMSTNPACRSRFANLGAAQP
jgi:hypothetical protein